jgi:hypothetical protein
MQEVRDTIKQVVMPTDMSLHFQTMQQIDNITKTLRKASDGE